jgi:hypothetical protein
MILTTRLLKIIVVQHHFKRHVYQHLDLEMSRTRIHNHSLSVKLEICFREVVRHDIAEILPKLALNTNQSFR